MAGAVLFSVPATCVSLYASPVDKKQRVPDRQCASCSKWRAPKQFAASSHTVCVLCSRRTPLPNDPGPLAELVCQSCGMVFSGANASERCLCS